MSQKLEQWLKFKIETNKAAIFHFLHTYSRFGSNFPTEAHFPATIATL